MELARLIGLGAIATLLISHQGGGIEFSFESTPDRTLLLAKLPPKLLWLWVPLAGLLLWSQLLPHQKTSTEPAAWYRVMLAFVVDAALYLKIVFVPLLALALGLEALHTGEFAWQFSRDFFRSTDNILLPAAFCCLALFFGSFGLTFATGRGTPGCLAAGIALTWEPKQSLFACAFLGAFAYVRLMGPTFGWLSRKLWRNSTFTPSAWKRAG